MCEVRSREKQARTKKRKYNGQQQKEMDCHEPHPVPNEKTQPIQWTKRPTGALVAVNSLCPVAGKSVQVTLNGQGTSAPRVCALELITRCNHPL
jgi:hypothetical protein